MISPTTVIVLAASLGKRFAGSGSKLAALADPASDSGEATRSVLGMTLRNAVASGLPVVVVTTAELAPLAHQHLAERDVIVVPTQAPGRGMGDFIAAGVSARAGAAGWLLLPGDMPSVPASAFNQVAQALTTHAVAYAQYRGLRGHPVGVSAELYSELVALSGDAGVRRLVARYPAQAVDVDDAGVLIDIATVQDLAALRAVKRGSGSGSGGGSSSSASRPPVIG